MARANPDPDRTETETTAAASRFACRECNEITEVRDSYESPGWMGTNWETKLTVTVTCPCCEGRGQYTKDDRGKTHRSGVLAPVTTDATEVFA